MRGNQPPDVASLIRATIPLRLLHRAVTHRFDLVAVGIAQECAVIIGGVIVAQAGWPVVGAAGSDTGAPERIDLASRVCLEAPVTAGGFVRFRAPAGATVTVTVIPGDKRKAARGGLAKSIVVAYAAFGAALFRRYAMKPMLAKPRIIIAQVDGSGAAAASVTVVEERLSCSPLKTKVPSLKSPL